MDYKNAGVDIEAGYESSEKSFLSFDCDASIKEQNKSKGS